MITEEMAEDALDYLKKTDLGAAKAKASWSLQEDRKKTLIADLKIKADGKSDAANSNIAMASEEYKNHLNLVHDAHYDWLIIYNKRESAKQQIEVWRSQNTNRRSGNI